MEHIYTITTITKEKFPECRCVGFYFDLDIAIKEVENNSCDINEAGYYRYCVIERVRAGIYDFSRNEVWFEWCYGKEQYKQLEEKPDSFKNIGNFGIG